MRYSMENVDASAKRPNVLRHSDGTPIPGVSEANKNRPLSDFADKYFNNLPALLQRDAGGNTVPAINDAGAAFFSMSDMFPAFPGDSGEQYPRLELLAGEMLALSQKAADGTASPEELSLLDTYQQFMQSRTGS
jgi:hypothetical protein